MKKGIGIGTCADCGCATALAPGATQCGPCSRPSEPVPQGTMCTRCGWGRREDWHPDGFCRRCAYPTEPTIVVFCPDCAYPMPTDGSVHYCPE